MAWWAIDTGCAVCNGYPSFGNSVMFPLVNPSSLNISLNVYIISSAITFGRTLLAALLVWALVLHHAILRVRTCSLKEYSLRTVL